MSGHHLIKMADLKNILTDAGLLQVKTYLQSGNLVFNSDQTNKKILENIISEAIQHGFGFQINVKVIEKKVFLSAFLNNPFVNRPGIETKQLYYLHLMGTADQTAFIELQNDPRYSEQMILRGELIYFYYPNGYGRSKLHGSIVEKKIKVSITARNHNTMQQLAKLLTGNE